MPSAGVTKATKNLEEPKDPQCLCPASGAPCGSPRRPSVWREAWMEGSSGGAASSERRTHQALTCPRAPYDSCSATPRLSTLRKVEPGPASGPCSPLAGFLSAQEVSNVRSLPPRIPSGGQAGLTFSAQEGAE
ncbi:hypothetical protein P7K49_009552 [Saguinus oedipus]|uniref:Uncharacterized protein n=1 Tax=Saguinus oedipus TaxID=9490 RepID=A0ABQ9VKY1_SAGOE|nr:hypothetical protein P7K49_009552 [Saguinus oedipus]